MARRKVADGGGDLGSAQSAMTGYALDRAHGTVVRVDPATFEVGPAVEVIAGTTGEVSALPAPDALYVVDHGRGQVAVVDPASPATLRGPVRSLAEPIVGGVVDGDGRLWTLGARTGDLVWFDGPERHSRRGAVQDPAGATLAVVDGRAALVERVSRVVRLLDGRGRASSSSCLDLDPADDSLQVGGSARGERLYVVSGDDGVLRVSDLGSGDCGDVVLTIAAPRSRLGVPQEARDRVFVPDYTTGTVVVVDLDSGEHTVTAELVTPGVEFELVARDGIVFYNDPGSERAGVIGVDGSVAEVDKYDPHHPGEGAQTGGGAGPPSAEAGDAPADQPGTAPGSPTASTPDAPRPPEVGPEPPSPQDAAPASTQPDPTPPDPTTPPGGQPDPRQPVDPLRVTATAERVEVGQRLTLGVEPRDAGVRLGDVRWSFGDGDTATGRDQTHAWRTTGQFVVSVNATMTPGGEGGGFATIEVVPRSEAPPEARFTLTTPVEAGMPPA